MTPPEGERAKLAGEVTEGDRALWESLCRLNACAANVEDYQEESVALIAKFRASVAVAEAVAERDADIALATSTIVKCKAWIDEAKPLLEKGGQAESKVAALETENKRLRVQMLRFHEALNEIENVETAWPDFNENEQLKECIQTAKQALVLAAVKEKTT